MSDRIKGYPICFCQKYKVIKENKMNLFSLKIKSNIYNLVNQ